MYGASQSRSVSPRSKSEIDLTATVPQSGDGLDWARLECNGGDDGWDDVGWDARYMPAGSNHGQAEIDDFDDEGHELGAPDAKCESDVPENLPEGEDGTQWQYWGGLEEPYLEFAGTGDPEARYEFDEERWDGSGFNYDGQSAGYMNASPTPPFLELSEEDAENVRKLSAYAFRDQVHGVCLPPIKLLSLDLLSHIFALVIPPQTGMSPDVPIVPRRSSTEPLRLDAPWVFGQVCWEWRALAISTPSLWTRITVSSTLVPRQLPLLHTQLARTGNALLDVLVRFTSRPLHRPRGRRSWRRTRAVSQERITSEKAFYTFLRTLVAHSDRWRTLHIRFAGDPNPPRVNVMTPKSLNNLEALALTGSENSALMFFDLSVPAPKMRRATLGYLGAKFYSHLPLPWSELTTYSARCSSTAHLRNLATLNAVVECDITSWSWDASWHEYSGDKVVTLPHLRRLAIHDTEFLDCITAPTLRSLYVSGELNNTLGFLEHSCCTETLTDLTLARVYKREDGAPAHEIISLLEHTRGLSTLAIDSSLSPDDIVAALSVTGPERICPNLESLSWADLDDELDRNAFVDMVASRCTHSLRARQQCIESPSDESQAVGALHFVALYAGRRRMKGHGMRLCALPGLDVVITNRRKGRLAVAGWRVY
ncbi:hypothetical protein DFH06DRAFT_618929 [Mycena polygramma]|nr:hypothetical protein DFH06DRAFT_618929 [Mycena polygramma]